MDKFFTEVKTAALNAITAAPVGESLIGWTNKEARLLAFLLKEGILSEAELERAVHNRLLVVARQCYDDHRSRGTEPDHTLSPEAFAYALKHGGFTPREERKIEFDHGDTKETFIQSYLNNIFRRTIKALRTERVSKDSTPIRGHSCDGCC